MITVKLKNVSVWSGGKYRNNQNYTINFFHHHGVYSHTTIDEIRDIINRDFTKVKLNGNSIIKKVYDSNHVIVEVPKTIQEIRIDKIKSLHINNPQ
jgi:hypothetical protein